MHVLLCQEVRSRRTVCGKNPVPASLIKVTLWRKVSMRSVPSLNFRAWQRRAPWGGGWNMTECPSPLPLSLPPKDFLEAEQALSKLNSQLSTRRKVYCSANWNALDFQQQPQGISQGLREEEDPKNIFLVFRKQVPCLLTKSKIWIFLLYWSEKNWAFHPSQNAKKS